MNQKNQMLFQKQKDNKRSNSGKRLHSKLSQRYEINLFLFCSFNATTNLKNRIVCPATWFRTGGFVCFLKAIGKLSYCVLGCG